MPSVLQAHNFQQLLSQLGRGATHAIHNMWHGDPANYPEIVDPYLTAAAQVSAHWYHSLAPAQPFAITTAPLVAPDVLQSNAEYALTTGNPFEALSMSADRHVFSTSAATIIHNSDREGVRYARYASATACAFCRLLATKTKGLVNDPKGVREDPVTHQLKFVTSTGRGARPIGSLYHDNCKCVAVPIRPGDDYRPPDYVKQWDDDYRAASQDVDTRSFDDIVNHMRRAEYARAHPKTETAPAEPAPKESPFGGLSQEPAHSVFGSLQQATP